MTSSYIDQFAKSYQDYNRLSPNRARIQLATLTRLESRLASGNILELQSDDLREWAEELAAVGHAPNTIRKQLGMVRPFFTWAWERKLIDADRLLELKAVKPPRGATAHSRPNPYTKQEIERFWREADEAFPHSADIRTSVRQLSGNEAGEYWMRRWLKGTSRFRRPRGYIRRAQFMAIAHLALYGGLRRSEIYRLSLEDANPENEYIVVRGVRKNPQGESRDRAVPWTPALREAVSLWLSIRSRIDPPHEAMWLSVWSKKWLDHPLPWRNFCLIMGHVGDGWRYHRLRHTYATTALRAGMSLQVLSRILGHSSIQQTLGYAKLVRSDLVEESLRVEDKLERALRP